MLVGFNGWAGAIMTQIRILTRWLLASHLLGIFLMTGCLFLTRVVHAGLASSPLSAYPPNVGYGVGGPMVMLAASRDHTLFSPIYTDYEDIDGDGVDDFTFKPTFRYYGYFDSTKCYVYNPAHSTGGRFEPVVLVSNAVTHTCPTNASYWSGNFLNWATMTRIDVVRKMLYGGFRRQDTNSDTTLEMAQMSQDAHSFVKYYSGSDIRSYTPFSPSDLGNAGLTICSRSTRNQDPISTNPGVPVIRLAKGNYSLWATIPGTVCRWSSELSGFSFGTKASSFYQKYGPAQGSTATDPTAHRSGLPVESTNGATYSGTSGSIGPQLAVRVQVCRADLLGSERCQSYGLPSSPILKPVGLLQEFGTTRQVTDPARAEFGLISGSYDSNLKGGLLRKNVGSLNDEIDPNTGRFCHRMTVSERPSTCANTGIIASYDAFRLFDQGQYGNTGPQGLTWAHPSTLSNGNFASWGNPMSEMVVQAISYFAGQSIGSLSNAPRDATVGLPTNVTQRDPLNNSLVDPVAGVSRSSLYGQGICRAANLIAISSGTMSYDTDEAGDSEDTYSLFNRFAALNGRTGETLTRMTDRIGEAGLEGINGSRRSVGTTNAGFGEDCTAKTIGAGGVVGTIYTPGLARVAGVCPEAPAVKGTYLGAGAAFYANTRAVREMGGAGRPSELTASTGGTIPASRLPAHALRVKTYAASLAGGVARIEVPIPGSNNKVYITPESSWDHGLQAGLIPGAMLTFRSIFSTATSGAYVVTWNDTQFGGDYDMDMVGFIRWELKPVSGQPGAYDLEVLTDVLNHNAGAKGSHGFSVIGADQAPSSAYRNDGRYLTHGSNGWTASGLCASLATNSENYQMRCNFSDGGMRTSTSNTSRDAFNWPSTMNGQKVGFIDDATATRTTSVLTRFRVSQGVSSVTLRDPLWYMAKYGSFDTGESEFSLASDSVPQPKNGLNAVNWDKENNNGQPCASGSTCADGEPDGYFLVRRPELLESRLRVLLERIVQSSNALPAVSSAQLVNDSFKYVAEFNAQTFNGTVKAFRLVNGDFESSPTWDAGDKLTFAAQANNRQVITNQVDASGVARGMPFTVSAINASAAGTGVGVSTTPLYKIALGEGDTAALRARADRLVAYVRGDRTDERVLFRRRDDTNLMGAVVSSSPWLQDAAWSARFTDADFPSNAPLYSTYVIGKASRQSVLWVGAHDGMLHGFNAQTGDLVMSYLPSPVVGQLSRAFDVTNNQSVPLFDGSPYTGDVLIGAGSQASWRTYLFSTLGRGGRAIFALDVTDPAALTEQNANNTFKWLFTSQDDDDLGYGLMDPIRHNASGQATPLVRLNTGKFGLLVPNGYRSSNGRAALFVIDVEGPGVGGRWRNQQGQPQGYTKILTAQSDSGNGLMGLTWVDLDNNTTADIVYATDIKGQLWKFDIRSANSSDWKVAFVGSNASPVPFFTAKDASGVSLSISTPPVVTFPSFGGVMISFGTGRSIEAGDFPRSSVINRFYSVWDRGGYVGDQVNPAPNGVLPRALPGAGPEGMDTFLQRLLVREQDTGLVYLARVQNGVVVPEPSDAVASTFNPSSNDGWLFQFPAGGEAVITAPVSRQSFLLFTTVRPSVDETQSCSNAPLATVYGLSATSGLPVPGLFERQTVVQPDGSVVEVKAYGVDSKDQRVINVIDNSTKQKCVGENCEIDPNSVCPPGKFKTRRIGASTDAKMCAPASQLRIQWREVPGMRTR